MHMSLSTRWLPTKPAPPVTKMRFLSLCERRLTGGNVCLEVKAMLRGQSASGGASSSLGDSAIGAEAWREWEDRSGVLRPEEGGGLGRSESDKYKDCSCSIQNEST